MAVQLTYEPDARSYWEFLGALQDHVGGLADRIANSKQLEAL